jgi:Na+/H+-dicarboxylate symporter
MSRTPSAWVLPAALALGLLLGYQVPLAADRLAPVGATFVLLIRALALPLLLSTIPLQLAQATRTGAGSALWRDLLTFLVVSAVAAAIGDVVAMTLLRTAPPLMAPASPAASGSFGAFLRGAVGTLDFWVLGGVLAVLPLTLLAVSVTAARPGGWRGRSVTMLQTVSRVTASALTVLLWLAPLGVGALAATLSRAAVRSANTDAIVGLLHVLGAVYLAQGVVVAVLLFTLSRSKTRSLRTVLQAVWDALIVALVTGSSSASLPFECEAATARLALPAAVVQRIVLGGVLLCKVGTAAFLGALGAALVGPASREAVVQHAALVGGAAALTMLTPPVNGGGLIMVGILARWLGADPGMAATLVALPLIGRLNTPVNVLGRMALAVVRSERVESTTALPSAASA